RRSGSNPWASSATAAGSSTVGSTSRSWTRRSATARRPRHPNEEQNPRGVARVPRRAGGPASLLLARPRRPARLVLVPADTRGPVRHLARPAIRSRRRVELAAGAAAGLQRRGLRADGDRLRLEDARRVERE